MRNHESESLALALERAIRFLLDEGCRNRDAKDSVAYKHLEPRTDGRSELEKRRDKAEEELALLEFLAQIDVDVHHYVALLFIRAAAGWQGSR